MSATDKSDAQIELVLIAKDHKTEVKRLKVLPNAIAEAACIIHEGRYYIYSGMEGRFFGTVRFIEVMPPVEIS